MTPASISILHAFAGGAADGNNPEGTLIADAAGDLFGLTFAGGTSNAGTVFELVKSGTSYTPTILYSFAGGAADGANPEGSLIMDASGDLFGTTFQGGGTSNPGTVFELVKNGSSYAEKILYAFTGTFTGGSPDGANPQGGLFADSSGDLFGTTTYGGTGADGTVFELVKNGTSYTETILHAFTGGSADGDGPTSNLIADPSGDLFGTTVIGGTKNDGTVFELARNAGGYTESLRYSFAGGSADGSTPGEPLLLDASGNLFSTTQDGGTSGDGTVFELQSGSSADTILHSFAGGNTDGASPFGGALIADGSGNLFGITFSGGASSDGTVFELQKSGTNYTETILHTFTGGSTDGAKPETGLLDDGNGDLIGTTSGGGPSNLGTVFQLSGLPISSSLTPHQMFVTNVYEQLLNRAPDTGGLAFWTNLLESGVAPSAVVLGIEQSSEYLTDVVTAVYHHYLGRAPDPTALQNNVNALAGGVSIESVTASILSSPEYFADKAGTNTGFVNGLYSDVLGRSADAGGFNIFLGALNNLSLSRAQVALAFLTTTEYDTDLLNGRSGWNPSDPQLIGFYPQFLHRTADAGGLAFWLGALASGASDQAALAGIFGSPEGYAIWS